MDETSFQANDRYCGHSGQTLNIRDDESNDAAVSFIGFMFWDRRSHSPYYRAELVLTKSHPRRLLEDATSN